MWKVQKDREPAGVAKCGEIGAKKGGTESAPRGSGGDAETRYLVSLLEKIAFQTYHGPKTFDEYVKFVREYADSHGK